MVWKTQPVEGTADEPDMECWHVTIASADRLPLARTEEKRRELVRMLVRVLGPWLVLFCVVDEHLHVILHCTRGKVIALRTALAHGMRPIVDTELGPSRLKLVNGRSHLQTLVAYLVSQPRRHGLPDHPASWSGSCYQDLIGARVLQGWQPHLLVLIPRMPPGRIVRAAGLDPEALVPATAEAIREAGAAGLARAASAAVAGSPSLGERSASEREARRAVAHLGREAGVSDAGLRTFIDVSARSLRRFRTTPPNPELVHAIRLQITLAELTRRTDRRTVATTRAS